MPRALQPLLHFRFLLPFLLLAAGGGLACLLVPLESAVVERHLTGFPDADLRAHLARPIVLGALCLLPGIAALAYALGGTFDRYLTRQFLAIFGVCLSALLTIWLLVDLSDNISDFRRGERMIETMLRFYAIRSPAVLLLLLPYALLLALLYALGRFSKDREIVAMIQSGRGLVRLCLPLAGVGAFCTLFCAGLNYQWAPTAEGRQSEILDTARGIAATEARDVLFHHPERRRLWMVGAFPKNYEKGEPLLDVSVTTTRQDRSLQSRLTAARARWDRDAGSWTFEDAALGRYTPGRPPEYEDLPDGVLVRRTWSETPWQLIKPGLSATYLGIPDLNSWLGAHQRGTLSASPAPYLTHWHYRWALPFTCLVTVFLAAPLSIHFSRRGSGGSVFLAVVLSALMMTLSTLVLNFGEAGLLHPALAAWLPNAAFILLGLYLFHRRISGRPIYQSLRRLLPGGA